MAKSGEKLPVSIQLVAEFARYADGDAEVAKQIIDAKNLEDVEAVARYHGFESVTVEMFKEAISFTQHSDVLLGKLGAGSGDELFILALVVMLEQRTSFVNPPRRDSAKS